MKVTHIGPDSQFLKFATDAFEAVAPGTNHVIVISGRGAACLRYPIAHQRVAVVSPGPAGFARAAFSARDSDIVVAHGMTPHAAIAFSTARRRALKVWSGWGFDYYGNDTSPDAGLLGPMTLTLTEELDAVRTARWSLTNTARRALRRVLRGVVRHAASRTQYFSAIPEDFEVFRRRFPEFRGGYSQLNYVDVAATFRTGPEEQKGPDVLVGNSASATNNHLEVFDLLAGLDLGRRRIVVPLSYGDAKYRDAVIARGVETFGKAFVPIVDFLPLEAYNAAIANCGVVIMNHQRQQAIGNISAALYKGAHVYLDERNPVYAFFSSRGARVRSTSELRAQALPAGPPSDSVVAGNRRMIEDFWGAERIAGNIEALLAKLRP